MKIENINPGAIEAKSFEIIEEELKKRNIFLDQRYAHITKRCIHTSADFDYAENMYYSPGVLWRIEDAIKEGCYIVTDTKMAQAGINKRRIEGEFGGKVLCFIGAEDVAEDAKLRGLTRSYVAMEKALMLEKPVIFVIGNAPTAIMSVLDMVEHNKIEPVAVVGAPVGFVNVEASKNSLMETDIPCIVTRGRKGGSNIAASIINAIQYEL